jgi:DNA-binding transcriptional regulator YhcF (GntR family)
VFSENSPIFLQLAAQIASDIISGTYPEGTAVPSASDYAVFYQMNPATAGKGVNVLVEQGVLFKKRGVGMFVAEGARELLRTQKRAEFRAQYIKPLLAEASILGIDRAELATLIDQEDNS